MLNEREKGASAVIVAASLVLILGMAAVAVDLTGNGFNQRRQAQIAADTAALAGALEFTDVAAARDAVLKVARLNLDLQYGNAADPDDPAWIDLWRTCTDTLPTGFLAVDAPSGWTGFSGGKIQCISYSDEEIRVRIPDQVNPTAFGPVIGANSVITKAVAQATFRFATGGMVFPFGLLASATSGSQICLSSGPQGVAFPPCTGSQQGSFGTVLPRQWAQYDVGTTVYCGVPGDAQMATAMRVGFDHLLTPIPAKQKGALGSGNHPGDATIFGNWGNIVKTDACAVSGGEAVPTDPTPPGRPPNTVEIDTGFPHAALFEGLVSDAQFPGSTLALLQQGSGAKRTIGRKVLGVLEEFDLDNVPLRAYLVDDSDMTDIFVKNVCAKAAFTAAPDKTVQMQLCLDTAKTQGFTKLFKDSITDSPRFGWAPQFIYDSWGSGKKWQPILTFQPVFLSGLWFNCNGNDLSPANTEACSGTKGFVFFPGIASTPLCDTFGAYGASCKNARLDQVSAYYLPFAFLPKKAQNSFPGTLRGPYDVLLSK